MLTNEEKVKLIYPQAWIQEMTNCYVIGLSNDSDYQDWYWYSIKEFDNEEKAWRETYLKLALAYFADNVLPDLIKEKNKIE